MIHFKAVRASRLLLWAAIVLFLLVAAILGVRSFLWTREQAPSANARLVRAEEQGTAKTTLVFASRGRALPSAKAVERRPSVLIYHTHTHEAYAPVAEDPYEAIEAWRTLDKAHSVVRVGAALAEALRQSGFEVVHDATDNEGRALGTAYTRSLAMLEGYDRSFDLYIDLHRDADTGDFPCLAEDGTPMARLMLLVGNGNGFEEKPFTAQNTAFAKALTMEINRAQPGLCKDVLVKDGRYNQNIGVFAILIEVGDNGNTLAEALNSVPPLAQALQRLMIDSPRPELTAMRAAYLRDREGP